MIVHMVMKLLSKFSGEEAMVNSLPRYLLVPILIQNLNIHVRNASTKTGATDWKSTIHMVMDYVAHMEKGHSKVLGTV